MRIACEVSFCQERFELARTANARETNRRMSSYTYHRAQYARFVDTFRQRYLDQETGEMPIFAYYGTNRSVISAPTAMPEDGHYDHLPALERSCDNSADFKRFFAWYRDQESKGAIALRDALIRSKAENGNHDASVTLGDLSNSNVTWGDLSKLSGSIELEGVRRVVASMIEGVTQLYVRRDPVLASG